MSKKLLLLPLFLLLLGAGCSEIDIYDVKTDGTRSEWYQPFSNETEALQSISDRVSRLELKKEQTVQIPLKNAKNDPLVCQNYCIDYLKTHMDSCTCTLDTKMELPLQKAVQLLVNFEKLKYVPEETSSTGAYVTK